MRRARHLAAWVAAALSIARPALAQPADAPAPSADDARRLADAKELFRQGVVLFDAGDFARALDLFRRSRDAFPSSKNTINAALCLGKLGRFDEAVDLYEEVLTRFGRELDDVDRSGTQRALAEMRQRVGALEVSSNVEGRVAIDGRPRGTLPLGAPITLLPGKHVVRVLKDGYATGEATVEVKVGATASVDVRLAPLAAAGRLRVEDPSNVGARLVVDRVDVGELPWEGTLGPGRHILSASRGDLGTGPVAAQVIQGQTIVVRLHAAPLGPPAVVAVTPGTAELEVDGVALGAPKFEGRLPLGRHVARATEAGYFDATAPFDVGGPGSAPARVTLRLVIDPKHPRWPRSGGFFAMAWGGFALGTSAGGGAEACDQPCTGSRIMLGGAGGARGGYRFANGFALEVGGGVVDVGASFSRAVHSKASDVTFALDDAPRILGGFFGVGVSERLELRGRYGLTFALGLDALFTSARDRVTGTMSLGAMQDGAKLDKSGTPAHGASPLLAPEVRFDVPVDRWSFGVSLLALVSPVSGPKLDHGLVYPTTTCARPGATPAPISCTSGDATLAGERAYGAFAVFTPNLFVARAF